MISFMKSGSFLIEVLNQIETITEFTLLLLVKVQETFKSSP